MKKNSPEVDLPTKGIGSKGVERQVNNWLTSIVIDLNLCPFAQREHEKNSIRFKTSFAESERDIVTDLIEELLVLSKQQEIETSLLILPTALAEFEHFNDFLGFADSLLEKMNLDGVFQIASFHPDYRFAGTDRDDAENYTNRAPYPMLHILRESSLDWAVDEHPDTDQIPLDNIALMNSLGVEHMRKMLADCSSIDD
ncbi:MAG: DUF1415 domain-containing protein [Arenicella sp.]|nr:DUF1415 domain-containing protein [Arenicella sp.]